MARDLTIRLTRLSVAGERVMRIVREHCRPAFGDVIAALKRPPSLLAGQSRWGLSRCGVLSWSMQNAEAQLLMVGRQQAALAVSVEQWGLLDAEAGMIVGRSVICPRAAAVCHRRTCCFGAGQDEVAENLFRKHRITFRIFCFSNAMDRWTAICPASVHDLSTGLPMFSLLKPSFGQMDR